MSNGKPNGGSSVVFTILGILLAVALFAADKLIDKNVPQDWQNLAWWLLVGVGAIAVGCLLWFTFYKPLGELRKSVVTLQNHLVGIRSHIAGQGVSWEEFTVRVLLVVGKVLADSFNPDLVVGVGRSGAIIAGMIAGFLGNKPVLCIDTDWSEASTKETERHLTSASSAALQALTSETKILFVQADQHSGESVRQVISALGPNVANCRFATLWKHAGRGHAPNYCIEESETKPRWPFRIGAFKAR